MNTRVEHEKRNSISTSNNVLFCLSYKLNGPLMEDKPTSSINENKWIDNPRMDRRVRWRWLLIWKSALNHYCKNNNGRNFNLQNSYLLTLSLPTVGVFQVNGQNRPEVNLPVVDFPFQPSEMLTPKPLNTQLSVILLLDWFSSPSRKVWTSSSVSDTDFLVS